MLKSIFDILLYKPLLNALFAIYFYFPIHDFGISIIFLTIIIKLLLCPFSVKAMIFQRKMSALQPKIKEIQKKYKEDKEKQSIALMEVYQKEKINPLSGCLPGVIEGVIFLSLFLVIREVSGAQTISGLYSFFPQNPTINLHFLNFLDLSRPLWENNIGKALVFLAGFLQFLQMKRSQEEFPGENKGSQVFQKEMLYFFPIFTIIILARFPAALGLYWLTTIIFSLLQQEIVLKKFQ